MDNMDNQLKEVIIKALLTGEHVNNTILIGEIAKFLNTNSDIDGIRVAAILTGQLTEPELLMNSEVYKQKATFVSYDIYKDIVTYKHDTSDTLWFKFKEDAEHYEKTGERRNYKWDKDNEHPYEGTYHYKTTDYCSSATWIDKQH